MKREITQEVRERIFGLYYGQKVMRFPRTYGSPKIIEVAFPFLGSLLLKSLSSITDEDAIEVAKILIDENISGTSRIENSDFIFKSENVIYKIEFLTDGLCVKIQKGSTKWADCDVCFSLYVEAADYLRGNSYAVQFGSFTVQELIDAGVYRIKTKEQ